MAKVLVSCPNMGWMHEGLQRAFAIMARDQRHEVDFSTPVANPVTYTQNMLVEMVKDGGYDYWITVDDDTLPAGNPLDLIDHDKDIVGMPTVCWNQKPRGLLWNVFDRKRELLNGLPAWSPRLNPGKGLEKVDHIGPTCMCIRRNVLEVIEPPVWEFRFDAKGLKVGNCDTIFSEKVSTVGLEMYCDWGRIAGHVKEVNLIEVLSHIAANGHPMAANPAWRDAKEKHDQSMRECGAT